MSTFCIAQLAETVDAAVKLVHQNYAVRIATLEAENAALRHDIERAVQRNSDLIAENETLKARLETSASLYSHQCTRCGHSYTPNFDESEDCPFCGHDGKEADRG